MTEAPLPTFRELLFEFLKETFFEYKIDVYWDRVTHAYGAGNVEEAYIFVNRRPCGRISLDLHFIHEHIGGPHYNVPAADPSFFPQLVDSIRRTLNSPSNVIEEVDTEVIKAWTVRVNGFPP